VLGTYSLTQAKLTKRSRYVAKNHGMKDVNSGTYGQGKPDSLILSQELMRDCKLLPSYIYLMHYHQITTFSLKLLFLNF
jgi:hypothetical protein